ncbi:class I adenylate-forming enzyme family protein [Noviherbaspirillum malthae]|uniref:class I adenylate-forming enzyme family protein n=1 Tax=Noviherbaspirillum malthae TaxID=1260987 RepID=UPI0018909160|nr:class I adenylate-forming enzyme family protein [Noviherbaspirillum malthae]
MTSTSDSRLHDLFDRRLAAGPDQIFLLAPDGHYSFTQLARMIDLLESELRGAGVVPGDRVMAVAENCPEHVALLIACSRIGAWSCGVNARMSEGEIGAFREKADPRIVYFTSRVSDAAAAHASAAGASASILPGLARSTPRSEARAEEGSMARGIAAIIFTSGTTGTPKGVLVSQAGLTHFGRISAESRQLTPADRSYAYLPMTHIFGLGTVLAASLHAGSALVMRSRFDPADLFAALEHEGVTNLQGPPAMFSRLLAWLNAHDIERPACPALRYLYTGAAPLDMTLKREIERRFGLPLHHGYGLSEYAGSVCLVPMNERRDDTAAGYQVEGGEVMIAGEDGNPLPDGERGEIWIRGTGLMPGYFRDPQATAAVMKPGGWYASGDIGTIGPDGALHVVGRLKEMIIRSGFNVYPGEVEAVLQEFPGVQRAAVVGRKERDGNEEILAFVETDAGARIDLQALDLHLSSRLAPYKRPARVIRLDSLPMTLSGKVLKRKLIEDHVPAD